MLQEIMDFMAVCTSCILCNSYQSATLCKHCSQLLRPIQMACSICAKPLIEKQGEYCGACLSKRPHFDKIRTAYVYETALRTLIQEFKYDRALYLKSFLGKLLLRALPLGYQTDCLLPVPLHPQKMRVRGFNHAVELTKWVAKNSNLPYDLHLCEKIMDTPAQASLNRKARAFNLKKAFKVNTTAYKKVTLVDDVVTTGNTVNELSKRLKEQGVLEVEVLCCAVVNPC